MFDRVITKQGALIISFMGVICAVIYMNIVGIDVNDAIMLIAGAMVKTFLDGNDTKESSQDVLREIEKEPGIMGTTGK